MTQTAAASDLISAEVGPNSCGSYKYSLTSVSDAPAINLSASELKISEKTGLISLYAASSAVVGTHTLTVTAEFADYTTPAEVNTTLTVTILDFIVPIITDQIYIENSPPL